MCLFYTFSNTYPRLFVCLFVYLFIYRYQPIAFSLLHFSQLFLRFVYPIVFIHRGVNSFCIFFITLKVNPYLRCVCSAKAPTVKFISLFKGVLYNHKLFSLFLKIIIIYSTLRCRDLTY